MKRAGRKEAKTRLTFVSSANLSWISGQFNKEGKKEKKKRKRKRKKRKRKREKEKEKTHNKKNKCTKCCTTDFSPQAN